ncbi:MAG TPA: hypothetical protein VF062_19290 [Candidatus Limnocylindrales bacterium]
MAWTLTFGLNVRMRRTFAFAAGWAVVTVLAAAAVWWGLGPLLQPIMPSAATPPQSSSPLVSASPLASASPLVKASAYEGWAYQAGVFTQTFTVDGGTATVRIVRGRVELVSSAAAGGYRVTPKQPSPDRLVVEFFDGVHFFIVDTMWWENRPYAKVTQVS